ncbi:hypothetical protein KI387_017922, partial [Taxus chinensis]
GAESSTPTQTVEALDSPPQPEIRGILPEETGGSLPKVEVVQALISPFVDCSSE